MVGISSTLSRRFGPIIPAVLVIAALALTWGVTPAFAQQAAAPACAGPGECLCDNSYEDCRAPILDLIQNEGVGIDVSIWFMNDARYSNALISRWRQGVPIRVIVDTEADAFYAGNRAVRDSLIDAGIPIRDKVSSGINHWKAMLFAGQRKVQFSAANYANGSLSPIVPYTEYVDEAIYFSDDPDIVNSFMRKFDDHWVDTSNFRDLAHITTALTRNYPTYSVHPDMNFVPDQHFENRLRTEVGYERQQADAVIFRITSVKIPDALIALHQAGVPVRVITEEEEYRNPNKLWHAYNVDRMYAAGIPIKVKDNVTEQDVHQKSIVLYSRGLAPSGSRGPMAVFGSSNWTTSSSNSQREHNYFTMKPWMVTWFIEQFERKWNNRTIDGSPIGTTVFIPLTPLPPDAPVYVFPASEALGLDTTVTLKWEGGNWAHKYDIYVDTTPDFTAPAVITDYLTSHSTAGVRSTKESYTISNLQPGTTYYWRIVSKTMADVAKAGPTWRFTISAGAPPPPAPAGLTGTAVGSTRIDLSWNDVAGEEGYKIERKPSSSTTWVQIAVTAADVTRFEDRNSGLTAGATYNYRIRAFSTGGNSAYSNTVTVTTPSIQLSANDVVLYAAEAVSVAGRWSVVADSTAAGGTRMDNPNDGATRTNTALANPTHFFEVRFPAAGGRAYRLWMRGKATYDNKYNDSVHVQFSDSVSDTGTALYRIGTTSAVQVNLEDCSGCGLDGWGWQDTADGAGVLGPVIYFAASGDHTLRVQVREDGASFDQIVLSPDTFLDASPGAAKQDTTILPRQAAPVSSTPDDEPPSVLLTSPASGATVSGSVTVTTQASDNIGVARVELWVDGARALTSTTTPFSFAWNSTSVANGAHSLEARAFDAAGNSGSSGAVSVNVSNSVSADIILYAAEAAVVAGSWTAVPDASAAGGGRISQPDAGAAKVKPALAVPEHYFEMTFNAEAGTPYRLWIRGRADQDHWANDSVHVQFSGSADGSGAPIYRIGSTSSTEVNLEDCSGCGLEGWGWQDNGWGVGVLGPEIRFASSGAQTIRVQMREDGFSIDQIVLSPNTFLTTSPGAAKQDTTILPRQAGPASSTTDDEPPMVSLTSPASGATVSGSVTVTTQASDNIGVARVELWVDGARALTSTTTPFSFAWNSSSVANGAHSLEARAFDAAGNSGSSGAVSVNVSNSASADIILYAAEAAVVAGSWTVVPDASAAGGGRISQPDAGAAKVKPALAVPEHYFEMTFNAEAGTPYRLWIRGRADQDHWANDSVHVQFSGSADGSGAPIYRIGSTSSTEVNLEDCSGCGLEGWGWQDNGWGVGVLGPEIRFASSGAQTIRLQMREDGFSIDQIVLSADRYLNSAPGGLKSDTTILQH